GLPGRSASAGLRAQGGGPVPGRPAHARPRDHPHRRPVQVRLGERAGREGGEGALRHVPRRRLRDLSRPDGQREPQPVDGGESGHDEPRPRSLADHRRREGPHGALGDRERRLQATEAQPRRDGDREDAEPGPLPHDRPRLARSRPEGARLRQAIRLSRRRGPMTEITGNVATAGRGRLAEVIALRGGKAAPEAPFVIEHREALIYMLYEAAELEHGIMCQYLFAAFSLKQREDEGLAGDALEAVLRWRRAVAHVATEEMLHLALVQNLLSAIGSAPHLARPNLPAPARQYPAGVNLTLVPFGEPALRHFMFLERPEGMELEAQGIDAPVHEAVPLLAEGGIVPQPQDFATIGHLYRSIEHGIDHLAEKFGERNLFVGPARAQATSDYFHWPELVSVSDLASAHRAIDTILEQGEGARGHWQNAHF